MGDLKRLWEQYAQAKTPDVRRELIEAYAPLARYVVDRMNLRPGPALGYDDLLSQAVVGLIEAIERFDPSRGIKFETYAYHRVRGAVMDMLREMDWVPRSIRQRESELAAAYASLEERLGRPPRDEEVAAELGVSVRELDRMAQEVALQAVQSLDEVMSAAEGGGSLGVVGDLVSDEGALSPEAHVARWAERELIAQTLDSLPEAERTVVTLYYYEGLTLKEIGRVLGVSESRACQIHGKAVVRLRAAVAARLHAVPAAHHPGRAEEMVRHGGGG